MSEIPSSAGTTTTIDSLEAIRIAWEAGIERGAAKARAELEERLAAIRHSGMPEGDAAPCGVTEALERAMAQVQAQLDPLQPLPEMHQDMRIMMFCQDVLDWNRRQDPPPIAVTREYAFAMSILGLASKRGLVTGAEGSRLIRDIPAEAGLNMNPNL